MTVLDWGIEKDLKNIADIGSTFGTPPNPAGAAYREIMSDPNSTAADKSAAQRMVDQLGINTKETGAPGAEPGGVGTFPDYSQLGTLNDSMLRPGEANAQGANVTSNPMNWLQNQIGNVSLVVLGVVVVGVALVLAGTSSRKFVLQTATAAVAS